jgi:hypothetical protein
VCISVIETKRPPVHGLVPLHSGYDEIPPGLPANHILPQIPWTGVELGLRGIYARKRPRSWVIGVSSGGTPPCVLPFSSLSFRRRPSKEDSRSNTTQRETAACSGWWQCRRCTRQNDDGLASGSSLPGRGMGAEGGWSEHQGREQRGPQGQARTSLVLRGSEQDTS